MATGDSLVLLGPMGNRPPASGFATLDLRGDFVVLDYDDTTNESAQFDVIIPSHYGGGDLCAKVKWTSSTATSGNAKLRVELIRLNAGDNLASVPSADDTDDFVVAAPSTSGDLVLDESDEMSVSGLTAGDMLRVVVSRLASDASDTMSGDLELVSFELQEA